VVIGGGGSVIGVDVLFDGVGGTVVSGRSLEVEFGDTSGGGSTTEEVVTGPTVVLSVITGGSLIVVGSGFGTRVSDVVMGGSVT
jgi:hypothetical protein